MPTKDIIAALTQLGDYLLSSDPLLEEFIEKTYLHNKWFTKANISSSLTAISKHYLQKKKLNNWINRYSDFNKQKREKTIGIVAAGNIPLVGFHDLLCVLITGNKAKVKLSEKDKILLPFIIDKLADFNQELAAKIEFVERLQNFDAVIATGSNNTARYFEYYFGKYPSIIRKNRNSVAVLSGNETVEDLKNLGTDIFQYFGLGCRNVSKLFVPKGYDFALLKEALELYSTIDEHYHYKNNLDYNRTLLLMNQVPFYDIDFVNIVEDDGFASPISNIHYQYYRDLEEVKSLIAENSDEIQCVVSKIASLSSIDFGKAQQPTLLDYADNIDTIQFLLDL